MSTYTLYMEDKASGPFDDQGHSTATDALDELEARQASGGSVTLILRDEKAIDEDTLRSDAETERSLDIG